MYCYERPRPLLTCNCGSDVCNLISSNVHLQTEDCSGRSTQVPFWRKWVIGGFEVVTGQKISWQNFGRFGPFLGGVTQGSSGGQIFKMLKMAFHVGLYQITREVTRITNIYSLLCVGCMVREISREILRNTICDILTETKGRPISALLK